MTIEIPSKGAEKMRTEIPIFFSTDDHYMPYLDVAVASLIANASKDYSAGR